MRSKASSPSLHFLGHEHDLDARELVGDRFATGRLVPHVLADALLGVGVDFGEGAFEIALGLVVEDHAEHGERELAVARWKMLGLGRDEAELQLAAALHHLEVEALVLGDLPLEIGDSIIDLERHVSLCASRQKIVSTTIDHRVAFFSTPRRIVASVRASIEVIASSRCAGGSSKCAACSLL
jgi:hypothetical protein